MDSQAEDIADSRSNVVGRKRALHTSSEQGREVISIDSSSDESAKQPRKRAKQDKETPTIESVKVEVDLTSSPLPGNTIEAFKVGTNIGQPVVWNQGVQSGLRTSFQSKKPPLCQNTSLKQSEQGQNGNEPNSSSSQSAKVNSDTVEQSQGAVNYKSIMTRKQLGKLPEHEKLLVMKAYTQEVSTLIDLHGWPVPKDVEWSCMKYIEDGLTFYPTPVKKDQHVTTYSFSGCDVKLGELLDVEGKPIKFEHITYPDIVRAILANNKDLKHALVDKRIKSAFKAYLNYFYSHVPQREPFVSTLVQASPPLKDILKNREKAPLLKVCSGPSPKENSMPKPKEPKKFENSGRTSSQKITQTQPASIPVVVNSGAPAMTSCKSTPPTLARAADHYDTKAPSAIINDGLVQDEAPIEHNNNFTSKLTTESNGKNITRVTPTLVTNVVDPTRDRRILTGADTVKMDHRRSSDSIIGSGTGTHVSSDGGAAIEVVNDQDLETLHGTCSSQELRLEDRAAILKYFPTIDGIVLKRCLICGSSGHERAVCPDSMCSSCDSKGDHLTPACPRTTVCGKCRAVGHQTSHCPEKLRVAKEDIKCILCQSPNHHEAQCHLIWRSFFPGTDNIKKVRSIPAFCYFCGRPGHFGPECGLHRGTPASGGISWSKANMEKYLDGPNSNDAISLESDHLSIPSRAKKGFSIKGKANDPIELDDSDDDDEGFIYPKVNMGPRNGQIQFSQGGGMQPFKQDPFQFQGNAGANKNSRAPPGNRGGRDGRGGGGDSGENKKPKHKSGNSPSRGGGKSRGKAYRGRGGGGRPRGSGAPRGRP